MAELIPSILAHAALGVALSLIVWAAGLGFARTVGLGKGGVLHAYALGLALVLVASMLVLLSWWTAPVGALLVVLALLRAGAFPPLRRLAWALPGVGAFGIVLGFLLHGPSSTLDSRAYGDLVFFASRQTSAAQSISPIRDFLVEGQIGTYLENGSAFVGAALQRLVHADPFLFQVTTLPVFTLASICIGLELARAGLRPRTQTLAVALLAVTVLPYPSWITETPPVALAIPLVFSLFALLQDGAGTRLVVFAGTAFVVDAVLTKGFVLIPALVLGAVVLGRRRSELEWRHLGALAVAAIVGTVGFIVVFAPSASWLAEIFHAKFLPIDAVRGIDSQFTTRDPNRLAPAVVIVAELALGFALLRERAWALMSVLATCVAATWFVGGHGLDSALQTALLLIVVALAGPARDIARRQVPLLATAGLAFTISVWLREVLGLRTGLLLVAVVGWTMLAALSPRDLRLLSLAGTAVLAAAAVQGSQLVRRPSTLTRADYGIWNEVHRVASPRDLVFTSLTGPRITGDEGLDYYPGIARRQIYIAGWANSPLLVDDGDRRRRLSLNERVLAGALHPSALHFSRTYGAYFAVVRRDEPAPGSFRRVYENRGYALYRIPS